MHGLLGEAQPHIFGSQIQHSTGIIREVRETHPDMKVIFISGYTEDSFRKRLDTDAEIHFLPKPFSLKQLASKVKEVISGEAVV